MAPQLAITEQLEICDNRMWRKETTKDIQRAIAKEREACARLVDDAMGGKYTASDTAAKIRARAA